MQYRADIDGLRAVAIIPVVLYHAGLGFHGGFVGVDIFFVISGYLLSSIVIQEMGEKRFSFLRFYERRFRRLAPAFMFTLAATYLAFSAVMLPEDLEALGRSALGAIYFYANFHFYNTIDYFSQSADLMPLLHMWSLAIEEQFYALLPISLLIALWLFPRLWLPVLIGLALLASFALCIHYTNTYRPYAFYMPHTRAWELLAGTLLAALPKLHGSERGANWLGGAALLSIVVVVFAYDERDAFPGWLAGAPVLATAALIYCGAVAPRAWPARLLALRPLVFIGKISYSLYLWHWPVIVFTRYADLAPDSLLTKLVCVLISVVLATLSWALVEQPVRRRKVFASLGAVYAGAGISAVAMSMMAAVIIWREGLPGRLPDEFLGLLNHAQIETSHDADCPFPNRQAAREAEPCLRGAPDQAPSFFLVGDSHAKALSPGLFAAAEAEGLSGLQWTAPGFFPGLGMRLVGSDRTDPRSDWFMDVIAARPEIETVIISAAWADYALGTNWKGQSWLYQDNFGAARTSEENTAIATRAIIRMIKELEDRQLILLDDVPAGLELDLNFYLRRSMLRSLDPGSAVLPHDDVVSRRAAYVPMLEAIAAEFDHVRFVPVFSEFCGAPTGCPLFAADEITPNYRDGDHLSEFGALSWTTVFQREIWR
jgi:peptidoglycan/LPS O-acetylase OafA/YrhL